jgi:hypothetical protein
MPAAKRHSIGKEEGSTDPIIIEHTYIYQSQVGQIIIIKKLKLNMILL